MCVCVIYIALYIITLLESVILLATHVSSRCTSNTNVISLHVRDVLAFKETVFECVSIISQTNMYYDKNSFFLLNTKGKISSVSFHKLTSVKKPY